MSCRLGTLVSAFIRVLRTPQVAEHASPRYILSSGFTKLCYSSNGVNSDCALSSSHVSVGMNLGCGAAIAKPDQRTNILLYVICRQYRGLCTSHRATRSSERSECCFKFFQPRPQAKAKTAQDEPTDKYWTKSDPPSSTSPAGLTKVVVTALL